MPRKTIGILGGGQLARMLVDSARKHGFPFRVYAQSEHDSVLHAALTDVDLGSLTDQTQLRKFFQKVDVITTENEFVDVDLLASASAGLQREFYPSLNAIKATQDKLTQKTLYQELDIPTSRFLTWDPSEDAGHFCRSVLRNFPNGAMLKWSRFGYDGKGNFPLRSEDKISAAVGFLEEGVSKGARIYAEEWIQFDVELALITAISANGDLRHLPMTITEQRDSICFKVLGPAQRFGIAAEVVAEAESMARRIASRLPYTGCFAIEFFYSRNSGLIVNEMAPRVHNTGHHTQLSSSESQFDLHLLSILGLPLPLPKSEPTFAMINILGTWPAAPLPRSSEIQVYDYNKDPRARRKLGHVNVIAANPRELENNLNLVESWIQ